MSDNSGHDGHISSRSDAWSVQVSTTARKIFLIFIGVHTTLWLLVFVLKPAEGGIDQSPAFLFLMIAYWFDTPARWLLLLVGMKVQMIPLFIAGTVQWLLVAWGMAWIFRKTTPSGNNVGGLLNVQADSPHNRKERSTEHD